jgi:hypothetical protein
LLADAAPAVVAGEVHGQATIEPTP